MQKRLNREGGLVQQNYGQFDSYPAHVTDTVMIRLKCRFDRAAVRRLVPDELEITPDWAGTLALQRSAPVGDRPAHSLLYATIEVEGHQSEDGSPGRFELGAIVSPPLHESYVASVNACAQPGEVAIECAGGRWRAVVSSELGRMLDCEIEASGESLPLAGFIKFLGSNPKGGVWAYTVSTMSRSRRAVLHRLAAGPAAPQWLVDLKPVVETAWAVDGLSFSQGTPRDLGKSLSDADARQADLALLATFSRLGRAALLVEGSGQVLRANTAALALEGMRLELDKPLRLGQPLERATLLDAISRATGRAGPERTSGPVALSRHGNLPPLVARVLPIALRGDCALVTLADPMLAGAEPMEPLRRLGLTAWEAGIAQRVGQGLSPKVVAAEMGLTIATTRSAMKSIYSKLSINRQAELVRLVTLLGTI